VPEGAGHAGAGPCENPERGEGGQGAAGPPTLPEGAEFSALAPEVKNDLRALPRKLAEVVGAHLVAAGMLLEEDPRRALGHARFAKSRAPRAASAREAVSVTAYHAAEWSEALGELRAVRRMTGSDAHAALMADCERALGRPERAVEFARSLRDADLAEDVAVELRIVAAGGRRDMGELEAAVKVLEAGGLDPRRRDAAGLRLHYAYADTLVAVGREREAIGWFAAAADADTEALTDAAERAIELADQLAEQSCSTPVSEGRASPVSSSGNADAR
jgi:tetratricopeptide (TPR) repeat protein